MGETDVALGAYMNRPDRIRSVLEYYMGEKLPDDWQCEEIRGIYPVRNPKGKLTFRQRDFIGKARAWGTNFLLGLENQNRINLVYPWRLMEMDCLAYGKELEEIRERNLRAGIPYGGEDDFMYRYKREDRVKPVLNLMLYWGKERWEAPLSLRDMTEDISALPGKLARLAGDYRVHVIHMRRIPEKALREMDSDLKYVLGIMRHTGSPQRYGAYIRENRDFFSRIPRSALDVIDACTNIRDIRGHLQFVLNEESNEEEADMCYALEQIEKNAEKKGIKKGRREGLDQGIRQGMQKVNRLMQRLLADGRQEDLVRATADASYQQKLFAEYQI